MRKRRTKKYSAKIQRRNVLLPVPEKTRKNYVLTVSDGRYERQEKTGVAELTLSFLCGLPCLIFTSVHFLQVSPDYMADLCTHGHRVYVPAFEQI